VDEVREVKEVEEVKEKRKDGAPLAARGREARSLLGKRRGAVTQRAQS
jgi:hypothetical protein